MKKAYLNYGTEDQVILWPVKNVDLESQSIIGQVTIKDLETGKTKLYKPKPKKEAKAHPAKKSVMEKVVDKVKKAVQNKKK